MRRLICVIVVCIWHKEVASFTVQGFHQMFVFLHNRSFRIDSVIVARKIIQVKRIRHVFAASCRKIYCSTAPRLKSQSDDLWNSVAWRKEVKYRKIPRTLNSVWLFELQHEKTNKWPVRSTKTQISLSIRPVWSESSLSAWKKVGSLPTHWVQREDWLDCMDVQGDLSPR